MLGVNVGCLSFAVMTTKLHMARLSDENLQWITNIALKTNSLALVSSVSHGKPNDLYDAHNCGIVWVSSPHGGLRCVGLKRTDRLRRDSSDYVYVMGGGGGGGGRDGCCTKLHPD